MKRSQQGFTLIETMVAISLAAVFGSAVIGMALQGQIIANSAKLKNQASSYAEQLVEQTRQYSIANGWQIFSSKSLSALGAPETCYTDATFNQPQSGVCLTGSGTGTFKPAVGLITITPNVIQVNAYVYYPDRGVLKQEEITSYLSNR